jgi:hypothetical protein
MVYLIPQSSGGVVTAAAVLVMMPFMIGLSGAIFFGLRYLSHPDIREVFGELPTGTPQ